MKKIVNGFFAGAILSVLAMWSLFGTPEVTDSDSSNKIVEELLPGEDVEEDVESKIESINQIGQSTKLELDGELEALFGDCPSDQEIEALQNRFSCGKMVDKSKLYWTDMSIAEVEVVKLLADTNWKQIFLYTGCDAYDLTWYELHCEADRVVLQRDHFLQLGKYIDALKLNIEKAKWVRKKPDMRKFRNPRWLLRSRLVLRGFRLSEPWQGQSHPTEHETVLLLEQNISGRISIVGIPVTGITN